MQAFGGKRCHFEEVPKKQKTSSSTSKQKHIFRFDKNPIDSSCFQVPDSGFKFQDLAIARISLVHSTATYKDRGKVRYLQCFLLRYGSLSTLQDSPGELQKLLGWILGGGGDHIYIYIHTDVYTNTNLRPGACFRLSNAICLKMSSVTAGGSCGDAAMALKRGTLQQAHFCGYVRMYQYVCVYIYREIHINPHRCIRVHMCASFFKECEFNRYSRGSHRCQGRNGHCSTSST